MSRNMFYLIFFQDVGLSWCNNAAYIPTYACWIQPRTQGYVSTTSTSTRLLRPGSTPRSNSPFRKRSMPPMRHMLSFQCLYLKKLKYEPTLVKGW